MAKKVLQLTYGELYFLNRSWPKIVTIKDHIDQKRWAVLETVKQEIKAIFLNAREHYTGTPISVEFPENAVVELKWYLQNYAASFNRPHLTSETILQKLSN